jgi:hypothetical protein
MLITDARPGRDFAHCRCADAPPHASLPAQASARENMIRDILWSRILTPCFALRDSALFHVHHTTMHANS